MNHIYFCDEWNEKEKAEEDRRREVLYGRTFSTSQTEDDPKKSR